MTGWHQSALSIAVFLPAAGAIAVSFVPRARDDVARGLGIAVTAVALGVGLAMLPGFHYGQHGGLQFAVDTKWITTIGARYHLGVDGISLPLFELTLLLSFLCMIYTWRFMPEGSAPKAFIAFIKPWIE